MEILENNGVLEIREENTDGQ